MKTIRVGDSVVGKLGWSFMVARIFSGENVGGVKDVVGVVGIPEGVSGVHRPSCNRVKSPREVWNFPRTEAVVGTADLYR